MNDVTAVIVSYNVRDLLLRCIASLKADGVERIVVVDNDSRDGSAEAVERHEPDVRVVRTGRNLGFGGGVNRGVALAETPYVLAVNPDVVVDVGSTKILHDVLEQERDVAIVAPRIDTPDGELYPNVRRFPDVVDAAGHAFLHFVWPANPFSRRYKMLDWDHAAGADVDWVAGTHFMARKSMFEAVGGFDEDFFMYGEDVYLCWSFHRRGWRVRYEPAARVEHAIGRSTDQTPYRMIAAHHRSLLRFAVKTYSGPKRLLLPVIAVALAVRTVLAWIQRRARGKPHAAP